MENMDDYLAIRAELRRQEPDYEPAADAVLEAPYDREGTEQLYAALGRSGNATDGFGPAGSLWGIQFSNDKSSPRHPNNIPACVAAQVLAISPSFFCLSSPQHLISQAVFLSKSIVVSSVCTRWYAVRPPGQHQRQGG